MVVFVLPPSGELRCIEIELRNTGPVGAANIHLVSRTAGLLSFGKKTTGPTAGLFEFPLVERSQPPLRLVQEDGTVSQVEHQAVLRSRQPFGSTVCLSAHMSIFFLFPCLSFFLVCPFLSAQLSFCILSALVCLPIFHCFLSSWFTCPKVCSLSWSVSPNTGIHLSLFCPYLSIN